MDKSGYVNARLTSFLEKDNSFLTPWSWDPKACENGTSSTKGKEYMIFPSGSYFSYGDKTIGRKNEFSFSSKEIPIHNSNIAHNRYRLSLVQLMLAWLRVDPCHN
ncbi:hypothetical protein TSUD_248030 [Trifolium subterraneum]|uniref:Uncharacterized protein n=1 Tax=Trifolium subterraneum TaxID=3900 RepID=A0A2Z6NH48_TRISU|nr:hypothetical protein TSUD_248030 [Trifolium subterraneum]